MIQELRLHNFKSFREQELKLQRFNVVVGANAAGKSNFLQAFKFIHDIATHGLQNAVAIQGGFKFLHNVRSASSHPVAIEALVQSEQHFFLPLIRERGSEFHAFTMCRAEYIEHKLKLAREDEGFKIIEDSIRCTFSVPDGEFKGAKGSFSAEHSGDVIATKLDVTNRKVKLDKAMSSILGNGRHFERNASLAFSAQPFSALSIPNQSQRLQDLDIAYYDFDPRLSKQAVRITGSTDLDESADNLAVVIQSLLANPKQRERLLNRLKDILPYVQNLDLEHFSDSSVLMRMRERYLSDHVFPASLISNGTVSVIATLIAVLFQNSKIVIMEEPERNIHPHLIERLLATIREASESKQIFISTHSPVVLDNCTVSELFLVKRDADGTSVITKPQDSEMVQSFIADDFGIGHLYETKLLEL